MSTQDLDLTNIPSQTNVPDLYTEPLLPAQTPSFNLPSAEDEVNKIYENAPTYNQNFTTLQQENIDPIRQIFENVKKKNAVLDKYENVKFDWDATNADRYVQSPKFNTYGFNPLRDYTSDRFTNESIYGYAQTWDDVITQGLKGYLNVYSMSFVEAIKDWKKIANVVYDAISGFGNNDNWSKIPTDWTGTAEELEELDKRQKAIFNKYAIYETPESKNSIFNKQFVGNSIQNLGFLFGMVHEMGAEELATLGSSSLLRLAKIPEAIGKLGKVGKLLTEGRRLEEAQRTMRLGELGKDLYEAADLTKYTKITENTTSLLNRAVNFITPLPKNLKRLSELGASPLTKITYTLGSTKRLLQEVNLAHTEAVMEGASTYTDTYKELLAEYNKNNPDKPISYEENEKIKKLALSAAQANILTNDVLLAVSNRIAFGDMFNSFKSETRIGRLLSTYDRMSEGKPISIKGVFNKAERQEVKIAQKELKSAIKTGEQDAIKAATEKLETAQKKLASVANKEVSQIYVPHPWFGQMSNIKNVYSDFGGATAGKFALKQLGKHFTKFEIQEGLEELSQNISAEYWKNHMKQLYTGRQDGYDIFDAIASQIKAKEGDSSIMGLSVDGIKTFLMGATTGMFAGPFSKIGTRISQNLTSAQRERNTEIKAQVTSDVSELNRAFLEPLELLSKVDARMNKDLAKKELSEDYLETGNKFDYLNIKQTRLHNLVASAIRTNMYDALKSSLKSIGSYSEKEINDAFRAEGRTEDVKIKNVQQYVNNLIESMDSYKETYEKLDGTLQQYDENLFPKGSSKYRETLAMKHARNYVIEAIASNTESLKNIKTRRTELLNSLISDTVLGSSNATIAPTLGGKIGLDNQILTLESALKGISYDDLADEKSKEMYKSQERELELLKLWKTHLKAYETVDNNNYNASNLNEDDVKLNDDLKATVRNNMNNTYKELVSLYNKRNNIDLSVTDEDFNNSLDRILDYTKLGSKAETLTNALNWLAAPVKYTKLLKRVSAAFINSTLSVKLDAIDNMDKIYKFSVFEKYERLMELLNSDDLSDDLIDERYDLVNFLLNDYEEWKKDYEERDSTYKAIREFTKGDEYKALLEHAFTEEERKIIEKFEEIGFKSNKDLTDDEKQFLFENSELFNKWINFYFSAFHTYHVALIKALQQETQNEQQQETQTSQQPSQTEIDDEEFKKKTPFEKYKFAIDIEDLTKMTPAVQEFYNKNKSLINLLNKNKDGIKIINLLKDFKNANKIEFDDITQDWLDSVLSLQKNENFKKYFEKTTNILDIFKEFYATTTKPASSKLTRNEAIEKIIETVSNVNLELEADPDKKININAVINKLFKLIGSIDGMVPGKEYNEPLIPFVDENYESKTLTLKEYQDELIKINKTRVGSTNTIYTSIGKYFTVDNKDGSKTIFKVRSYDVNNNSVNVAPVMNIVDDQPVLLERTSKTKSVLFTEVKDKFKESVNDFLTGDSEFNTFLNNYNDIVKTLNGLYTKFDQTVKDKLLAEVQELSELLERIKLQDEPKKQWSEIIKELEARIKVLGVKNNQTQKTTKEPIFKKGVIQLDSFSDTLLTEPNTAIRLKLVKEISKEELVKLLFAPFTFYSKNGKVVLRDTDESINNKNIKIVLDAIGSSDIIKSAIIDWQYNNENSGFVEADTVNSEFLNYDGLISRLDYAILTAIKVGSLSDKELTDLLNEFKDSILKGRDISELNERDKKTVSDIENGNALKILKDLTETFKEYFEVVKPENGEQTQNDEVNPLENVNTKTEIKDFLSTFEGTLTDKQVSELISKITKHYNLDNTDTNIRQKGITTMQNTLKPKDSKLYATNKLFKSTIDALDNQISSQTDAETFLTEFNDKKKLYKDEELKKKSWEENKNLTDEQFLEKLRNCKTK